MMGRGRGEVCRRRREEDRGVGRNPLELAGRSILAREGHPSSDSKAGFIGT